jgi:hypothetical protein
VEKGKEMLSYKFPTSSMWGLGDNNLQGTGKEIIIHISKSNDVKSSMLA